MTDRPTDYIRTASKIPVSSTSLKRARGSRDHVVFAGDDVVGTFLRPIIARKSRAPKGSPSWANVAKLVSTYTQRNEAFLVFLESLDAANLKEVFDVANQHLKDWNGVESEMTDPLVKRAVADHSESIRQIKLKTRSILERDLRQTISRSTADRVASKR